MGTVAVAFLLFATVPLVSTSSNCTVHYVPSPLEERWLQWVRKHPEDWFRHCKRWKADRANFDLWINQALTSREKEGVRFAHTVFSHQVVNCTGRPPYNLYLEPLAAALRNPYIPCVPGADVLDTSFLLFPSARSVPHTNAYFFDVGSTYYDSGFAGYNDSLAWFIDTYRQKGFHFRHIFAWEAKLVDHKNYWERVPADVVPRMQFFNTPASDNPSSPMNPLRMIQKVAHPEDYVVLKLDIDNNDVEVNIIQQLLHNPKVIQLVDELFWENHVHHHPLSCEPFKAWGDLQHLRGPCSTGLTSYECFRQLRAAGIRAHSWI